MTFIIIFILLTVVMVVMYITQEAQKKNKEKEEQQKVIKDIQKRASFSPPKPVKDYSNAPKPKQAKTSPSKADIEKIANAKKRLKKYIVFDLETTGLDPRKNEIIEIGAVKVEDGNVIDTFSSFVKPKKGVKDAAREVNGITDEMLADAPSINRILPEFKKFIGSCTLIAHNAEFDCKFLYIACARFRMKFTNRYIDTLEMAKKAYPNMKDHKLSTLCNYFGIENETAHRALSDSQATQKVFSKLADITPPVTHAVKPIKNVKMYDTRYSEETKNIIELIELINEVTAKSNVTDRDFALLSNWLVSHRKQNSEFPASRLPAILAMPDHEQKRKELKSLTDIVLTQDYEKSIDICGKTVVLHGEFREGSFDELSELLGNMGATVKGNALKSTDYFVIGEYGSPDWSFGNYGGNYKKMMEYIDAGSQTVIISEHDFFKALK